MIDIERQVFNAVYEAVNALNIAGLNMSSQYNYKPASFPHVCLVEVSNTTDMLTRTTDNGETHADIMYELDVYSNLQNNSKQQCKDIAKAADEALIALNFRRTMLQPVQNLFDATVYRITGRYVARVDTNNMITRR